MIDVLIGGDVCPIGRNLEYFKKGDAEGIFNDLLGEFQNAQLSIVNLECPLIEENSPIVKIGPALGAPGDCINGFKAAHIDILNLANNHIMDHGSKGLINTLQKCDESGIATVGAGLNLETASRILIREIEGIRIGVLGIAEREFSIATETSPGASPLDAARFIRNVKRSRGTFDYLIVLVHAGACDYPFPSPRLMDICRFMAENGADVVLCQHSHCPGTIEQYEGSYIVYGQGNLVFDWKSRPGSPWTKGFLVKLSIETPGNHELHIIPFVQSDQGIGAKSMSRNEAELFKSKIREMSLILANPTLVEQEWISFCNEQKNLYFLNVLFGMNSGLLRRVLRRIPVAERFATKKRRMLLHNLIRCETHREIIETILGSEQ